MKINFKRITAIGASLLMAGMTVGIAAAATFPAPFVTNGNANVAIVYGTGAGVSPTDQVEAANIQTTLSESVTGTGGTSGGESYQFEKTSTKFHLGDHYVNISTNLDNDELPVLLADGKYLDNDNDEIDYSQKIIMGALGQLTMFEDNDYIKNEPTVGFRIPSSQTILTYELTFNDALLMTDMPTSTLPIMGKEYYVLSNTSTTLTLLDSAVETVLANGETAVVDGNSVSIEYIGDNAVKFSVDGEVTNTLAAGDTYKLTDDSYIGVKEILYNAVQGADNKVEFSIGKGKLKLTDGGATEVQINDVSVPGVVSDFTLAANALSLINLTWSADTEVYVTETKEALMPGFEILKLSYGGLNYPAEEIIEVANGGTTYLELVDFPTKGGVYDIAFLYGNSTYFTAAGESADSGLITDDNNDQNITFDEDLGEYFVASWTDGTMTTESYLMKANGWTNATGTVKFDLSWYNDGVWSVKKSGLQSTDDVSVGSMDFTIGAIDRTGKSVEIWEKAGSDTGNEVTSFNTLYSAEGLTMYLPWVNTTATNITAATSYTDVSACDIAHAGGGVVDQIGELGYAGVLTYNGSATVGGEGMWQNTTTCTPRATTFKLVTIEEDKSGNNIAGDTFNVSLGWSSASTPAAEVSAIDGEDATFKEIGATDVWRSFMYSALATEILHEIPDGTNSVKLKYHGDEVAADVFITSPDATIIGGSLGNVLVTDAEINSVKAKNLIIVGGSCINAAAAGLLGSACGPSFTTATGVGSGQFLIQSFGDAYTSGKIALLVAGYDLADTNNAATFLRTQTVDTTAGNKYVGTSGTEATLQVA